LRTEVNDLAHSKGQDVCFAYLDDVWMAEFAEVFDFPNSRHVETILELSNLDFLDGNSPACGLLSG